MNSESGAVVGVLESTDDQGRVVKSSKRLFGAILISAGGALLVAIGAAAIFREVADPATALRAGESLIITGAALLGVGVLEGIATARKDGGK